MAKFIKRRGSRFKHLNPQLLGPKSGSLNIQATDDNYSNVQSLNCGIARASNGPRFLLLPYLVISFTIRSTGKKRRKWNPTQSLLILHFAYVLLWSAVFQGWGEGGRGQEKPREELRPLSHVLALFPVQRAGNTTGTGAPWARVNAGHLALLWRDRESRGGWERAQRTSGELQSIHSSLFLVLTTCH